jgi:hypothetical protein
MSSLETVLQGKDTTSQGDLHVSFERGGPGKLNTGKGGRTAPRNRAGRDPRAAGNDEEAYAAHA